MKTKTLRTVVMSELSGRGDEHRHQVTEPVQDAEA